MSDTTTVEVSGETWERLRLRKDRGESFDDVIQDGLEGDFAAHIEYEQDGEHCCNQCGNDLGPLREKVERDYLMWIVPVEGGYLEPHCIKLFCSTRCLENFRNQIVEEDLEEQVDV